MGQSDVKASSEQVSNKAVEKFINTHGQSDPSSRSTKRLKDPIVIPQRRPGQKSRGFIEAYAPDLEQFGITKEAFLDLISAVNDATKTSKWLFAIQVAAAGAGFVPNNIAMGTAAGVQLIAGIIAKAEQRWKTNSFLDSINENYFRPRRLYCVLMTYNPIATGEEKPDDINTISKSVPSEQSSGPAFFDKIKTNLRNPVAGTAKGEENLPSSVAALEYQQRPSTDPTSDDDAKKTKGFGRLNNYLDRRAQARYMKESEGDVLSVPSEQPFKNRLLDPNHPISNGGLVGLLSGGKLTRDAQKYKETMQLAVASQETAIKEQQTVMMDSLQQQLGNMQLSPEQQQDYIQQYQSMYDAQLQQLQQTSTLVQQGHRRIIRNVMYLMIVNMPSESEMKAAQKRLDGSNDDMTITTVE